MINWDFSRSHSKADAGFGTEEDEVREFDTVKSVRITLPRGQVFEASGGVTQVIAHREGELLNDVSVTFGDQSAEDAVKRAKDVASKLGLIDGGSFKAFLDGVGSVRREKAAESNADTVGGAAFAPGTKRTLDEPEVSVSILDSFDEKRPWLVEFQLGWFNGDSYSWDFTKSHTVDDVRLYPRDRDEWTLPSIAALRIALPGGKEYRIDGREGEARLKKNGDTLAEVHTLFGEPSPEDAHRRAAEVAAGLGVPVGPLDTWLADVHSRTAQGENEMAVPAALSSGPHGGGGEPVISVGLHWEERYKLDLYELPWVVDLVVAWPS